MAFEVLGNPMMMKAGNERPIPVRLLDVLMVFQFEVNISKKFLQTVVSFGRQVCLA